MKIIAIVVFFLLGLLITFNETAVSTYVHFIKNYHSLPAAKQTDSLYQKIIKEASKYEIKPQDATIDRVWKKIPGYNGQKVDISASYKKMKSGGKFDDKKLVFKQIQPKVHLKDLPPSPIYKGNPEKPMVSFIINVAWGNEYLSEMLKTLKRHHISASFFLEGNWVKKNPDLAKMIVDAGHEVGNHSYTHPDMKRLSADRARTEMIKTNEVIEATTGKKCVWFAPPSGSYRDETVKVADELKMETVMWTVDTVDWQKPTPDVLINRVISKVGNGSLILMHPTESTAKALDRLITLIEKKNLTIGTVTELMDEKRIIKENEKLLQHKGKTNTN
jgi:probable sporulation protein (polysaccharide deacetylase family)